MNFSTSAQTGDLFKRLDSHGVLNSWFSTPRNNLLHRLHLVPLNHIMLVWRLIIQRFSLSRFQFQQLTLNKCDWTVKQSGQGYPRHFQGSQDSSLTAMARLHEKVCKPCSSASSNSATSFGTWVALASIQSQGNEAGRVINATQSRKAQWICQARKYIIRLSTQQLWSHGLVIIAHHFVEACT